MYIKVINIVPDNVLVFYWNGTFCIGIVFLVPDLKNSIKFIYIKNYSFLMSEIINICI